MNDRDTEVAFQRGSRRSTRLRAAVAIPVRNEERDLAACLDALLAQTNRDGGSLISGVFGVVLLLNNCDDDSEAIAGRYKRRFSPPPRIETRRLTSSEDHAGTARRLAMDLAAEWLECEGRAPRLILTTDADSRVGPTWIEDNLAAIESGAEAVAGDIELDPFDHACLPAALHARGALEDRYGRQLIEIGALLDPQAHNPWPHHGTMSGASLAVTLPAYRRIGGLPALPVGEDKALVHALRRDDVKVRFAPEIRVVTSGRLAGRACGGVADTIRLRCEAPDAPCDAALEPLMLALARSLWRGRMRRAHAAGASGAVGSFGRFWEAFEAINLPPGPLLRPTDLPLEINRADRALGRLRVSAASREIEPEGREALAAYGFKNGPRLP